MAYARISLTLEIEVVDADLKPIDTDSDKWEETQDACIEAAMTRLTDSLANLEFEASDEQE